MDLKHRDTGCLFYNRAFKQQTGTLNYDFGVWIIPSRETMLGLWLSKYREAGFKLFSCMRASGFLCSEIFEMVFHFTIHTFVTQSLFSRYGSCNASLWIFFFRFIVQQLDTVTACLS